MDIKLFNLLGLLLCAAGAIVLAYGLIVPDRRALEVGLPRVAADDDEQNAYLPHVRDRMRESRLASVGIVLMTVGFLLQVIGNWPGLDGRPAELLTPAAQNVKCS
jgi:hypothetical protein